MNEGSGDKLTAAVKAAEKAGKRLLDRLGKVKRIEEKTNRTDLVTEADRQVQKFIIDFLKDKYPKIGITAEENFTEERDSNWIIDPIDGTTNFAIGYPIFCVSIALEEEGNIKLGVVHVPVLDETFTAKRNEGARLNGESISVSVNGDFSRSVLATGFPYEKGKVSRALEYFAEMTRKTRGIRRDGAAAIDLCYVANGRFDGFWELGLKPWDVAAGSLIVKEAGGKVSTMKNKEFHHRSFEDIAASNGLIHEELVRTLGSKEEL